MLGGGGKVLTLCSRDLGCPQAGNRGGKATRTLQVGPQFLQGGNGSWVKLKGHQVSVPAWKVEINACVENAAVWGETVNKTEKDLSLSGKAEGVASIQTSSQRTECDVQAPLPHPARGQAIRPVEDGGGRSERRGCHHVTTTPHGHLHGLSDGSPPGSVGWMELGAGGWTGVRMAPVTANLLSSGRMRRMSFGCFCGPLIRAAVVRIQPAQDTNTA